VYGTVLRTRTPTAAAEIAADADCDPKTVRRYLKWFAELGIVVRRDGQPIDIFDYS
jgi:DNA-binding IclR family transcriptional regulator